MRVIRPVGLSVDFVVGNSLQVKPCLFVSFILMSFLLNYKCGSVCFLFLSTVSSNSLALELK